MQILGDVVLGGLLCWFGIDFGVVMVKSKVKELVYVILVLLWWIGVVVYCKLIS